MRNGHRTHVLLRQHPSRVHSQTRRPHREAPPWGFDRICLGQTMSSGDSCGRKADIGLILDWLPSNPPVVTFDV